MHSAESHAEIHHPGLLRGADFCDSGVEMAPDITIELPDKGWHLFPFGEKTPEPEAEKPMIGRIYRTLTGGDICEELVDVSAHKHFGHSSAVKVRPTIGVPSFTPPHRGHHAISKIGPIYRLPPFKYPDEILEIPKSPKDRIDPVPLVDQDQLELDPDITHLPLDMEQQETVVDQGNQDTADSVIFNSRGKISQVASRVASPVASPSHRADSTASTFSLWKPFPSQSSSSKAHVSMAEKSAEHLHDGHSRISKVREVPVSFYNVGPSRDIIFSSPNIEAPPTISHVPYEHFLRSVHQGHCATSKVQPYSGDDPGDPILGFGVHRADRDDRRGSSRCRLDSSRSASELVAY